jgi:hypothetical protein
MEDLCWPYTDIFLEAFFKAWVETLPQHQTTHNAIDMERIYKSPDGLIYPVSEFESKMFIAYIKRNQANGFTQ